MKRMLMFVLMAAAVWAGTTANAGNKKNKKTVPMTAVQVPVKLVTPSDSVSYAAGYTATRGLLPYLQQRMNVDTAYLADFVRGFREAIAKAKDPAYVAYQAGTTIASQASESIFPGMGRELKDTKDSLQTKLFYEGFIAGVKGDTSLYKAETAAKCFESKAEAARNAKNAAWKAENEKWMADNAGKPGVVTMPSGLQYKVITAGNGPKPTAGQTVEVNYEGKTIDGKVFDATSRHGSKGPDSFRCDQVIKGWTEALTNMPVGSKWEVYIPQELAYGAREAGQIKPYSTLVFTIELVGIQPEKTADSKQKDKSTATKATKTVKAVKTAKGKAAKK